MTEKVKLTREQAVIIECFKTRKSKENILKDILMAEKQRYHKNNECLKSLSFEDMARALLIGYEVQPEYKVGDWVVHVQGIVAKVIKVEDEIIYVDYKLDCGAWLNTVAMYFRYATSEEIKAEQERRWWAKQGRGVWELKQGDVLMATRRTIYEVTADPKSREFNCYTGNDECDFDIEECKRDNWKVICFHENRKDVRRA